MVAKLDELIADTKAHSETVLSQAKYYKERVIPAMESLRTVVDQLETCVADEFWPLPTYADLMFRI